MPAAIRVTNPQAPPLYQWIETEVIRIGSKLTNEICIAGLPPHVATVIYRDGEYYLLNRTNDVLRVGSQRIASHAEAVWRDATELQLPGQIGLTLIRHEDPRPVGAEPGRAMPEFDAPEKQRLEHQRRRHARVCFAVTVLAVFGTAFLSHAGDRDRPRREYQQAMAALSAARPRADSNLTTAGEWIQKAYSVEQRGDRVRALEAYRQARDLLLRPQRDVASDHLRRQLLQFVAAQLTAS